MYQAWNIYGLINYINTDNYEISLSNFLNSNKINPNNLNSLIGQINCYKKLNKYDTALSLINEIIVKYPKYILGLLYKAEILMIKHNWDESYEKTQRVLLLDKYNIDALLISVICLLAKDNKSIDIIPTIQLLIDALARNEATNHHLYYQISKLCTRLCNNNVNILNLT